VVNMMGNTSEVCEIPSENIESKHLSFMGIIIAFFSPIPSLFVLMYHISNPNHRRYILYTYSTRSKKELSTVHRDLQLLMEVALKIGLFDLTVIKGTRTFFRQKFLFATGATKTMDSRHLTGHAVDIGIFKGGKIDYEDEQAYYVLAGLIYTLAAQLGIKVRWGGNWDKDTDMNDQNFNDLVHWELV